MWLQYYYRTLPLLMSCCSHFILAYNSMKYEVANLIYLKLIQLKCTIPHSWLCANECPSTLFFRQSMNIKDNCSRSYEWIVMSPFLCMCVNWVKQKKKFSQIALSKCFFTPIIVFFLHFKVCYQNSRQFTIARTSQKG